MHLWTDESYPVSATAEGGIFVWNDGRENPDHCVTALTYPKGFLYTYKTLFGNSYRSFSRIHGTMARSSIMGAKAHRSLSSPKREEWITRSIGCSR